MSGAWRAQAAPDQASRRCSAPGGPESRLAYGSLACAAGGSTIRSSIPRHLQHLGVVHSRWLSVHVRGDRRRGTQVPARDAPSHRQAAALGLSGRVRRTNARRLARRQPPPLLTPVLLAVPVPLPVFAPVPVPVFVPLPLPVFVPDPVPLPLPCGAPPWLPLLAPVPPPVF